MVSRLAERFSLDIARSAVECDPCHDFGCTKCFGSRRTSQTFIGRRGAPVVLNASFNHRDEPIVNSPAEAISTFYRTGIETLVIGNYVVRKG
jgi:hypothetical protein